MEEELRGTNQGRKQDLNYLFSENNRARFLSSIAICICAIHPYKILKDQKQQTNSMIYYALPGTIQPKSRDRVPALEEQSLP